jgi:hypothetical protein
VERGESRQLSAEVDGRAGNPKKLEYEILNSELIIPDDNRRAAA